MNEQEFAELSAGHALAALSPEDERRYRDALAVHPEWAAIAAADEETAVTLAEGVAPVAPPLAARSQLLNALDAVEGRSAGASEDADTDAEADADADADSPGDVPSGPPTEVVQAAQRRTWTRGVFALVASIVLLVGIGWGTGALAKLWNTPAAVTALEEIERAPDASSAAVDFDGGQATAHWSQSVGKVVLVADGLPQLPSDRTFELWFVRGDEPVPAGTFAAEGGEATAELTGTMQPGDTIAVTVEPAGGSPNGRPTTAPIIAIPTV